MSHVETDCDLDAALLVEDGAIVAADTAVLPFLPVDDLVAGDVVVVADVVGDLPDRVVIGNFDSFTSRKDLVNPGHESSSSRTRRATSSWPFALVMEVIDHEEASIVEEAVEAGERELRLF